MPRHLKRFGAVSTMIERDDDIPEFPQLRRELAIAEDIAARTLPADALVLSDTSQQQPRTELSYARTA